jgi:small nuclear ribonucleoprotein (snRNP)-like protein
MVVVDGRLEAFDTPMNLLKENAYYQFATAVGAGPSGLVTS